MSVYSGETLIDLFRAAVADRGDDLALVGPDRSMSWHDYSRDVDVLAQRLRDAGLAAGERVALLMDNLPDFHVADMAVLHAGGVPFSIDPRDPESRVAGLLEVARPPIVIADARHVATARTVAKSGVRVCVFDDLMACEQESDCLPIGSALNGAVPIDRESIATLIFTSGTTGAPKAVQLAHRVMVTSLCGTDAVAPMGRGGRVLSYLPLTHIAERFMSYYFALATGSTVYCVPAAEQLYDEIVRVRPTRFFGVPRVYEKLAARARTVRDVDAALTDADVVAAIGLDETEYRGVATAPSSDELLGFFADLGVPVSNIWGMSEAIMCTVNPPDRLVTGSVGRFLDSCVGRVADDGELLVRGSNVMSGYLDDPERTAEVLDGDGWLHTGDLGRIDDDGYLFLLGRKKDILVTATGKNIVPTRIEDEVRSRTDLLSAVVVVAEGRRFVTAILVPDADGVRAFASRHGLRGTLAELTEHAQVLAAVEQTIDEANQVLAKAESIRNWVLLPDEWSPGSDVMTSTMKIRRSAVTARYAREIDRLYR